MAGSSNWRLEVTVQKEFEECLELVWELQPRFPNRKDIGIPPRLHSCTVEMVLDRGKDNTATAPPKDAMIKQVEMGSDSKASIQNMPEGRRFFIAVAVVLQNGGRMRSPWVRAATLDPADRDKELGNLDPMNKPRLNCEACPCAGYIATRWNQFLAAEKLRCRRCGCPYDRHQAVDIVDILRGREDKACKRLQREKVTPLPGDSLLWDEREDSLWFLTEGTLHPRRTHGEGRAGLPDGVGPGGPEGMDGRKGRVSVVTPTTESRRKFHEALWACFSAQRWPEKELVVVETYFDSPSDFFIKKAQVDTRLVYLSFKRPRDKDWSIGLKRNIGAHLASGEFIANFDDDDLYAPTYLSTMVAQLELRRAQAVTLSSWFVVNAKTLQWSFCDPIAWGVARGLDENTSKVRSWAYGYGFSYVNRRRASLETPYDDRNMGEDFAFVSRLQAKRTDECVQLVHDDFGICLHTQHGGNTSETFPIREVSHEEALDLDVAELPIVAPLLRSGEAVPRGPSRRQQELRAHVPEEGTFTVTCPLGSTTDQFVEMLEKEMEKGLPNSKVHRVPTAMQASTVERENAAVEFLGVASVLEELAEEEAKEAGREEERAAEVAAKGTVASESGAPPGAGSAEAAHAAGAPIAAHEGALSSSSSSRVARGRQLVLQRAKRSMKGSDRIPPRTTDLWLASPGEGAEEEEPSEAPTGAPDSDGLFTVEVTCQTTSAKKYLSSRVRTFQVMLPHGTEVGYLREILHPDLPAGARVLAEGREHPLQDREQVPGKITVTEFVGKKMLYARFSRSQCAKILDMIRSHFDNPDVQAKMDEIDAKTNQDEFKHKLHLSEVLMSEVYPNILRHYGLPCNKTEGLLLVPQALAEVGKHLELLELQMEAEKMMRNWGSVRWVHGQIMEMRASLGHRGNA